MKTKVVIIIPNWNGAEFISESIYSLKMQSTPVDIVVVDNGSIDNSIDIIEKNFSNVTLLKNSKNLGFSGGVNTGLRWALEHKYTFAGLFNNDAVADKDWVKHIVEQLKNNPEVGAVAGKLLRRDGKTIDSTGDLYSTWGLPIARQRNEKNERAIKKAEYVFGATAGACIYRTSAIKQTELFDERFFAYYEDSDINFRLQLLGWKAMYEPKAIAYHEIGGTSSKISGFTTYQTMKNLPMLFFKDMPIGLMPKTLPRFFIAYYAILLHSLFTKRGVYTLKGHFTFIRNLPYVINRRREIQKNRKVSNKYVWSILFHDLPPDADRLKKLRKFISFGMR